MRPAPGGGHRRPGRHERTAGLLPDEGGAWLFPRVMGLDHATRMVLLGERYDAHRALELGLVTQVLPANSSRDAQEGVVAFREKRPPRFEGR